MENTGQWDAGLPAMYSVIGFVWPWQSILYAFEELFHNLTQHDMIDLQKMINGVLT